jgi:hypothetical protein
MPPHKGESPLAEPLNSRVYWPNNTSAFVRHYGPKCFVSERILNEAPQKIHSARMCLYDWTALDGRGQTKRMHAAEGNTRNMVRSFPGAN